MKKWKNIIDNWILDDLIADALEISFKILIKVIQKKWLHFMATNNIVFNNKEEEEIAKKYFQKSYLKKYKKNVTYK